MELSLGPFLTCLTTSLILTVYFYYVLYRKNTFFAQGKRFVFIGIILILLRMAVPVLCGKKNPTISFLRIPVSFASHYKIQ